MSTLRKVYLSCSCNQCSWRSSVKKHHKRNAHRMFRRRAKEMLRRGDDSLPLVSTGYLS